MLNDSFASNTPDDAELMQLIARRESEALRLLYQRHAGLMLALCMRITRSRADAEDVVLDVFHEIWQRADRYDPSRASPLTYLTMVTRSRALDYRRAHPTTTSKEAADSDYLVHSNTTNTQPQSTQARSGPLGELLAGETRASVRSALGGLSPEERELIEFCYFDGMTHSQIADRTHQPLGTIKTRIRRGLARLRGRLRLVWDERPPLSAPSPETSEIPGARSVEDPETSGNGIQNVGNPSGEPSRHATEVSEIPQSAPGSEVV